MRARSAFVVTVAINFLLATGAHGQFPTAAWPQWGQNSGHTGAVPAKAQKPELVLGKFTYDGLAEQIRDGGDLLVHYMAPLVDGNNVYIMSRGGSQWVSCKTGVTPCGTARWAQMEWGVTRLQMDRGQLLKKWTVASTWKPPPDTGSGWEPVFHPALSGRFLFVPGAAGTVMRFDWRTGTLVDSIQPFNTNDPARYVTSPLTLDAGGAVYYTVMKLDAVTPWSSDAIEAWLVKIDAAGKVARVSFGELVPRAPVTGCTTTFVREPLPWPPSADAKPPLAPCGSQRPGLNAAPTVGADGTVYAVSRAHFNDAYGYLIAVNADLTARWSASLRGRLNDGCDVMLPASGTLGGCRSGSLKGVDPATNDLPAGRVQDQSTASPVVAPDGSILLGTYSRYNYGRGHLFRFSAAGFFIGSYDFGWDITPAIFAHGGSWSAIIKDNFYAVGSYCGVPGFCGEGDARYNLTSLTPDLHQEWTYRNTNEESCEMQADGTIVCVPAEEGFEWCVNMVAVDKQGTVYANSEDGNVYAIDVGGREIGRLFLKSAIGAAYTPLAIGSDGRIYTQNDGVLFVAGEKPKFPRER